MKQIKSFEDACKVEGLNPKKVVPSFATYPKRDRLAMIALAKLAIIVRAANRLDNGGKEWKPDWSNTDQYKYYPWFYMGGSSGFRFLGVDVRVSLSVVGSRLCFKSREVAEHIGKKFQGLYKQFMVIK